MKIMKIDHTEFVKFNMADYENVAIALENIVNRECACILPLRLPHEIVFVDLQPEYPTDMIFATLIPSPTCYDECILTLYQTTIRETHYRLADTIKRRVHGMYQSFNNPKCTYNCKFPCDMCGYYYDPTDMDCPVCNRIDD